MQPSRWSTDYHPLGPANKAKRRPRMPAVHVHIATIAGAVLRFSMTGQRTKYRLRDRVTGKYQGPIAVLPEPSNPPPSSHTRLRLEKSDLANAKPKSLAPTPARMVMFDQSIGIQRRKASRSGCLASPRTEPQCFITFIHKNNQLSNSCLYTTYCIVWFTDHNILTFSVN